MKKTLLIVALAGLSLTSCKKDYTCECKTTVTEYDGGVATVEERAAVSTTFKAKKKDAEASCDGLVTTSMVGNTTDGTKMESACSLK